MSARREFEMSERDLRAIVEASQPTIAIAVSGPNGPVPVGGSPQENANAAWCALGRRMGFDGMTVEPVFGKAPRFFTAVPAPSVEVAPARAQLCGSCDTTMAVADVPHHLRGGLCRWVHAGVRTGDFLRAVLENDLRGAVRRADNDSAAALANVVRWLYLEAPGNCWGSPVLVAAWERVHEERRAAAPAAADAAALNATGGGA